MQNQAWVRSIETGVPSEVAASAWDGLCATLTAEAGDGFVRLSWDDVAERGIDPVSNINDFEGYRIYRSTDPDFLDPQVITTVRIILYGKWRYG